MIISNKANILKRTTYINHVLVGGSYQRVEIPAGVTGVGFGSDVDFYCQVGDSTVTAEKPTTNVTDGSGCYFNPPEFQLFPSDTHIAIYSEDTGVVTLYFF